MLIGTTGYNFKCSEGMDSVGAYYTYIKAINKLGASAVILPTHEDIDNIPSLIRELDGIVLTGGEDISPCLLDVAHGRDVGGTDFKRDLYEMELYREARRQEKPILGICRGMQLMAVLNSMEIISDLDSEHAVNKHDFFGTDPRNKVHKIPIGDEFFRDLFGKDEIYTNSFHHQGIAFSGNAPFPNIINFDINICEAIADPDSMQMGFQWHPERSDDEDSEKIFRRFIKWCKDTKEY